MSSRSFINDGNDTIHHYPPAYEGKLTKLLCISKEIFEKLTLETRELFSKRRSPKNIPAQTIRIKPLCETPILPLHYTEETKYSVYTPTKIWQTRYSEFWQWQRVSEWHREYGQDEITNEKRHILV